MEEGGQHGSGMRLLTAFVGGIDTTNGRYDTGRHSLFRTLEFEHSDDMHQPCIPGADIKFGGRQQSWSHLDRIVDLYHQRSAESRRTLSMLT